MSDIAASGSQVMASTDQEKLGSLLPASTTRRRQNESPSQKTAWPRWQRKGKEKSSTALACTWMVDHQISISLNFIFALFFVHVTFPAARHHTQKFFRISYYNPATGMFALGWDDIFFVFYWLIVFTGLRCAVMDYVLTPLASLLGIRSKKPKVRFAEQAWILTYACVSWLCGLYNIYNSDYWMDLRGLWRNWPIREMEGFAKWYYLVQFGFWLQQIVVVNIEERRKDFWNMFTHHIVTCILIFASYGYHHYRVGTLILCLMDMVDVILPAAKILKYLHYSFACDIAFGLFLVTWLITRHGLYFLVLYSIYAHIPQEIRYGCYKGSVQHLEGPFPTPDDWAHLVQPFRDPVGLVCFNHNIKWGFLGMLGMLQCVLLVWFVEIVRVAYKVITGQGAEDVRSDDEDDEDEDEAIPGRPPGSSSGRDVRAPVDHVKEYAGPQPYLEAEVLSTDANFSLSPTPGKTRTRPQSSSRSNASTSPPGRQSSSEGASTTSSGSVRRKQKHESAHSSGVNLLAGSSDRKELLGRIGCDKGSASE